MYYIITFACIFLCCLVGFGEKLGSGWHFRAFILVANNTGTACIGKLFSSDVYW